MATYARIANDKVAELTATNLVGLPAALVATFVDVTAVIPQPKVGWGYTAPGLFYAPLGAAVSIKLTSLQFIALLTPAEQAAVTTAALANAALMLWLLKLSGASYVDLSDPQTIGGMAALVAAGLLTPAREAQILAGTAPTAAA